MPSFGSILSNVAAPLAQTVASNNLAQIAERDKQRQFGLQQLAAQRESELANMQLALGNRTLQTPKPGDPNYGAAMAAPKIAEAAGVEPIKTQGAINTAAGIAPIKVQQAIDTAAGTEPIKTQGAIATAQGVEPIKTAGAIATAKGVEPIKTQGAIEVNNAKLPGELQVAQARAGLQPRVRAAAASLPQFDSAIGTLRKYSQPGVAGRLFSKSALGGYAISAEGQIANQAADQAVQAYLNGRGMRNAPASQVEALKKQILIQPGEEGNQAVIDAKQRRLWEMRDELAGLGMVSGPAPSDATTTTPEEDFGVKPVRRP